MVSFVDRGPSSIDHPSEPSSLVLTGLSSATNKCTMITLQEKAEQNCHRWQLWPKTYLTLSCRLNPLPWVEIRAKLGTIVSGRFPITLSSESGSSSITPGRIKILAASGFFSSAIRASCRSDIFSQN